MQVEDTALPGVKRIVPRRFGDHRGFFAEIWNARAFREAGLALDFVQDNHSLSPGVGTLRGLHFQAPPHGQGKLVRCGRGRLFDVAVDIRRGSPTYGQAVGYELSAENGHMLWIPEGFAHGFVTREPDTEVVYKCTGFYEPTAEGAVHWELVDVPWMLSRPPSLSERDARAPRLDALESPFRWEGKA